VLLLTAINAKAPVFSSKEGLEVLLDKVIALQTAT
jgi:hypothetical protein